jgi:hypothetical protein
MSIISASQGNGFLMPGLSGREAAAFEAAVGDVVDVGAGIVRVEADGVDRQAVADEVLFEVTPSFMVVAQVLAELGGPDVGVFLDEVHEQVAEELDVVGLVAQGVAEHLADAGELVLAVEREHHAEEAVELGALHALAEDEDVFGEACLFSVSVRSRSRRSARAVGDEVVFAHDRRHVLEHRLALVRVDAEREIM